MTRTERLSKARTRLLLDHPFYGTLVIRLPVVECPGVGTMSTDGTRVRYDPEFVDGLTDDELMGVLAHEVLHVAHGHVWRRDGRDSTQWNVACDYAINHILVASKLTLPSGVLIDPAYTGAAEEIYRRLPKPPPNGGGGAAQGQGSGSVRAHESPMLDGGGLTPSDGQENATQGEQRGLPGALQPPNAPVPDPGRCGAVEDAPADADVGGLEADWKVAIGQAAMAARSQGQLPGGLEKLVEELLNPRVAWEVLLRDFVERTARNDYAWQRPNRRYLGRGIVLPSLVSEELPAIVIAVDSSASVSDEEMAQFAAEVSAVLGAYDTTIHLVWCDAVIQHTEELTRADLPLQLTRRGYGGTNFCPVFDWTRQQGIEPAALIYLTDMGGTFPSQEPDYPVLWISVSKGPKAPFGDTVEM